jgi:hypothetical protein
LYIIQIYKCNLNLNTVYDKLLSLITFFLLNKTLKLPRQKKKSKVNISWKLLAVRHCVCALYKACTSGLRKMEAFEWRLNNKGWRITLVRKIFTHLFIDAYRVRTPKNHYYNEKRKKIYHSIHLLCFILLIVWCFIIVVLL